MINKVSAVNNWLLLLLVKNLNDSDTRQEIMSKVKEMDLDDTIAFMEGKETSRKAAWKKFTEKTFTKINLL